jgi:hypothetical protein
MDEFGGPHAYLRIDNGLVKSLIVHTDASGLSVVVRLPPEVFPILRRDIAETLSHETGLVVPAALDRGRKSLRGLFRVTHLPERSATSSQRRNRRPARLRELGLDRKSVDQSGTERGGNLGADGSSTN